MATELIAIGRIGRPVGLSGVCAVEAFGDTFGSLDPPCKVFVGNNAGNAAEMVIAKILIRPAGCQCTFEGRLDRTAVEQLRGRVLFVEGESLPALEGNDFYHFELKGMEVVGDSDGSSIGTVIEVHNFPAMDTIEVAPVHGETIMVPLNAQAVISIDKKAGRITVFKSFIEELLQ